MENTEMQQTETWFRMDDEERAMTLSEMYPIVEQLVEDGMYRGLSLDDSGRLSRLAARITELTGRDPLY